MCGGPDRGSCINITNEDPCENKSSSSFQHSRYCLAQQFLKSRPGTNQTDFRYKWPTQIFHRVCNCSGNYDGYNCMTCRRGYTGKDCNRRQAMAIRKNVMNLNATELNRFLDVLQTIKRNKASGYTVPIIEPVTTEPRDSFAEISLLDVFTFLHFTSGRDAKINSCFNNSIISQFCNKSHLCPVINHAHNGPAFLTWHRKLMLFVETEIQRVLNDSTFGFPYWDWTDKRTRNKIWDIVGYSNCGIFAKPSANNTVPAPINGSFSNWTTICADAQHIICNPQNQMCDPTRSSGKVQRCIGGTNGLQCRVQQMLPDMREFEVALEQRIYDLPPYHTRSNNLGFRNSLEGFESLVSRNASVCSHFAGGFKFTELHNRVHFYIGGTMISIPPAANDPVFYLHHSNVDRLYEEWLKTYTHRNESFPSFQPSKFSYDVDPGHNIDEYLVPHFPIVTNRYMHHKATSFGYRYEQSTGMYCIGHTYTDIRGEGCYAAIYFSMQHVAVHKVC